jgi:hypothetical protein
VAFVFSALGETEKGSFGFFALDVVDETGKWAASFRAAESGGAGGRI